jgi:hypothetical protein
MGQEVVAMGSQGCAAWLLNLKMETMTLDCLINATKM